MAKLDLNRYPKTLREVNRAVQKRFPHIEVAKVYGHGYFIFMATENAPEELKMRIGGLQSNSIYVYTLDAMPLHMWVSDVATMLGMDSE